MTSKSYRIRPATYYDLGAVYRLMVAQNQGDYGTAGITPEKLKASWASQAFNLEDDARVILDENDILEGYVEIHQNKAGQFSVSLYLVEGFSELKMGNQLLAWVIRRAGQVDPYSGSRLSARVSEKNQTLQRIFSDAGYQVGLTFLTMEILMGNQPSESHEVPGIRIQPFRHGKDEHQTYLLDEETARDKGYHQAMSYQEWSERMGIGMESHDPTLWHLAWSRDELVGLALNFYWLETKTGWIDHLGVKRDWRRQGIGKALLLHSMREFHNRQINRVRLNVDSHSLTQAPKLYREVGMTIVDQYHIYTKEIEAE